jgi:Dolichyl-phosphate-mannose-protein mannosyltransferase/DolP-mannose mannosyltransferase
VATEVVAGHNVIDLAAAERSEALIDPTDPQRDRGGPPVDRARSRSTWKLLAVLVLLTIGLRMPAFFVQVFNSDETFLATQGEVINHGGTLYKDAADRKPPLVPYLYAATFALFGTTALWSVRAVAMLAVIATAMLLALEARRRYGERAAWYAGILFVLSSVAFAPQDGQAANFEIFMLPLMTASVLLAARGKSTQSGIAAAAATLAKQTGALTLIPVLYLLSRERGKRGVARALVGFAVPISIVALLVGPGDLWFWAVQGNGSYFGLGSASAYVLGLFAVMTVAFLACNAPIVWSLPAAWRRSSRADADLWLWLGSSVLSVAVGFRFFGHYYLQLLPPMVLLSAGVLARRSRRVRRGTVIAALVIAVSFSMLGYWVRPWADHPKYQAISQYLDAHTAASDPIFVWGHMPEIYWASDKRPSSRLLSSGFWLGDWGSRPEADAEADVPTPGAFDLLMHDLHTNPPKFVLDTTPASFRGSQYHPISQFPAMVSFLRFGYRYVGAINEIAIYERRPVLQSVR